VSASQLEGWLFDSPTLGELPKPSLGKSVHLNRPDKNIDQTSACRQSPKTKSVTLHAIADDHKKAMMTKYWRTPLKLYWNVMKVVISVVLCL